jgi:hypothetical protein
MALLFFQPWAKRYIYDTPALSPRRFYWFFEAFTSALFLSDGNMKLVNVVGLCFYVLLFLLAARDSVKRGLKEANALLFFWLFIPFVSLMGVVFAGLPTFIPRYILFTTPAYCAIFALYMLSIRNKRYFPVIFACFMALNIYSLVNYYKYDYKIPWRKIAAGIQAKLQDNDKILLYPGESDFTYYYKGAKRLYKIPSVLYEGDVRAVDFNLNSDKLLMKVVFKEQSEGIIKDIRNYCNENGIDVSMSGRLAIFESVIDSNYLWLITASTRTDTFPELIVSRLSEGFELLEELTFSSSPWVDTLADVKIFRFRKAGH